MARNIMALQRPALHCVRIGQNGQECFDSLQTSQEDDDSSKNISCVGKKRFETETLQWNARESKEENSLPSRTRVFPLSLGQWMQIRE